MNYTHLFLFAVGLFGILIHNFMKMDDLNRKQNGDFKFGQYMKIERFSIALSVCLVIVCVMVSREIKQLQQVGNWLGMAFLAIGYMAQSIVIKFSGRAEKYLNEKNNDA